MNTKRARILLLIAVVSAILIFSAFVSTYFRSVQLGDVFPALKEPQNIPMLHLEIDDGRGILPLKISDPSEINKICDVLSHVDLVYRGRYSGIEYSPEKGDFLVSIYVNTPSAIRIYLKQDGAVFDGTSCYQAKGTAVAEFYQDIIEKYYIGP